MPALNQLLDRIFGVPDAGKSRRGAVTRPGSKCQLVMQDNLEQYDTDILEIIIFLLLFFFYWSELKSEVS